MAITASRRKAQPGDGLALAFHPLTPSRWDDFAALFGARGACGGCWCMTWRRSAAAFKAGKGEGNRRAMRRLVMAGEAPGVLAYAGGEPVGWCAVAPRERYVRLAASRTLAPVDDAPVWAVSCFFVRREWRGRGLTVRLLGAAADHARAHGARLVEGYPYEPPGRLPGPFVWTGLAAAFRAAGFTEVARRSATRPIMRLPLGSGARGARGGGGKARRSV
jgi:GNAT superfamily N-acetyltransferase